MIVVTCTDRLARSDADLAAIARERKQKNVSHRATEQPFDTSTATGR
jgi:DNA invertase Pin-like site-specific DNA recombinase